MPVPLNEKSNNNEKIVRVGGEIQQDSYVKETKQLGSGCGPACILTAYKHLFEQKAISVETAVDLLQSSMFRQEVAGRTTSESRGFLIEELNKIDPEHSLRREKITVPKLPEKIVSEIDSRLESGSVIMVGVGENYLFETLKSEIPQSEVESIDELLSELENPDIILQGDYSFAKFDEKILALKNTFGEVVSQYAYFYMAMHLTKSRDASRWYWTLEEELSYTTKLRENVINKIIPPQNIQGIDIKLEREKLGIPNDGFPKETEHKRVPLSPSHAIIIHGIVEDASGEENYLFSDPMESYGPNRTLSKKKLVGTLNGRNFIEIEVLSKE